MKKFKKTNLFKKVRKIIFIFRNYLVYVSRSFLLSVLKILPTRILVDLKQHLVIVRKMDYAKCDILLDLSSSIEYATRLYSCKKEPETIKWIENFFKEGDVFFDIGANVGCYSLVASKFYNQKIKVYAFEPGFSNFGQLCKNVILNECQDSVIPLQIALSDKTALDFFNYSNIISGAALHALGKAVNYKGDVYTPIFKQLVLSQRLDDFIKQNHIPIPNHMKIDVDGIEFGILRGADEILCSPLLKSIILEVVDGNKNENKITELLISKGFELHSKYNHGEVEILGGYLKIFNCIFLRKNL